MQKIIIIIALFSFIACTPKDQQFCECLKVSEEFNELTQKGIAGELSKEELSKAKQLMDEKSKICEPYETMGGREMMKKKAACGIKE